MKERINGDELADIGQLDSEVDTQILKEAIKKAIAELSTDCQRILLALLQGYATGGIAGVLTNVSREIFDEKIHRVRECLKKILQKEGYIDEMH